MINRIETYMGGELHKLSIEDIKNEVTRRVGDEIRKCDEEPIDVEQGYARAAFSRRMFVKSFAEVNSKNIEYVTSWHFMDYVCLVNSDSESELKKVMDKYSIKDVYIRLFIYRLGQYSYFATECTCLFAGGPFGDQGAPVLREISEE